MNGLELPTVLNVDDNEAEWHTANTSVEPSAQ
jgi:hypothetical protein